MPVDSAILTGLLQVFVAEFLRGYARIYAGAWRVLSLLALIDIALAALIFLLVRRSGAFGHLALQALKYGAIITLVTQWITLAPRIITGFIGFGLHAGGSTITVSEFTNPSKILELGLLATAPIWAHIRDYGIELPFHLLDVTVCGILGLVILGAYALLAGEMFVFLVHFYLKAVLTIVILPAGVNRFTSWIARYAAGGLLESGLKVMVLAFLTSVSIPLLLELSLPPDPTWTQLFWLAGGVWMIAGLAWAAPRWAAAWFLGGTSFTAAGIHQDMVGSMMMAGLVGQQIHRLLGGNNRSKDAAQPPPRRDPGGARARPQTP